MQSLKFKQSHQLTNSKRMSAVQLCHISEIISTVQISRKIRNVVKVIKTYYDLFFCSKVQYSGDVISEGRIRVVFSIPCEPNLDTLIQNQHVSIADHIVSFIK